MKTVLLAYERDQDLAAIETVLQSRGHRVLKARSGVEALDAIRTQAPDAVVSDVLLPRLDGFALCRRLREDPSYLHLPFLLHSFRVEGPKYEAFAAEVGAQRFFPRGSTLEDVAAALEEHGGSGTVRIPVLVPELLDKREQDRRRLAGLEQQVRELEATNTQLAAAERSARERAEREARARAEFAAAESVRIRELQARIRELETAHRQATEAVQQSRGAADESRAEIARMAALETRLNELQLACAQAQAAASDAERAFTQWPTPAWVVERDSGEVLAVTDSGAALAGVEPDALRGRKLDEVLPGASFTDDAQRGLDVRLQRPDGTQADLELRRQPATHGGRSGWLVTARDVTAERALQARAEALAAQADALSSAPEACGLVDDEGQLRYANRALLAMLGVDAAAAAGLALKSLEADAGPESTVRSIAWSQGALRQLTRWRRNDGVLLDVEVAAAPCDAASGLRVLTVRDVTLQQRAEERRDRERERLARLLDLAQRAHALTETELLERTLQLAQDLTDSPLACLFLPVGDAALELAAVRGVELADPQQSVLSRWRGAPPQGTALSECWSAQRPVVRDATEGTGPLVQAGLPGALHRQVATPLLDGARLVGALLVADAHAPYDDDDRGNLAHIADAASRLLKRRRSDAEVVSAMDHMERVMFGAIESLAQLAESQDACKIGRARRVADHAAGIGTALGLPGHTVRGLRVMAQLIDVGMLQIPRELLWRPGTLDAAEFELIKTHPDRGHAILRDIEFPWPVAEVVRQHHERLDGSGYPRGLKGEQILLEARIVAVADAVEAMLSPRPHRPALSLAACLDELQSQAGRRYDAAVVKACVRRLRELQPAATTPTMGETPARIA